MSHDPVFQVDRFAVPAEKISDVGGKERAGTDVGRVKARRSRLDHSGFLRFKQQG